MKNFSIGLIQILVVSDLSMPRVHVPCNLIVQYDVSKNLDRYVSRAGTTARFDGKRVSIVFVTREELTFILDLERYYSTKIVELRKHDV